MCRVVVDLVGFVGKEGLGTGGADMEITMSLEAVFDGRVPGMAGPFESGSVGHGFGPFVLEVV